MDDLGTALSTNKDMIMMGGGNPGHITEVQDAFHQRMEKIMENPEEFKRMIGIYDPPQGDAAFLDTVAELLREEFGWNITGKNVGITNGSQAAFFILFNMFAGDFEDGTRKKVLFPLAPEYIGYADIGISHDFFVAEKPLFEMLDDNLFKYRVDFENLKVDDSIGAICVSRPTNPTGNVITDNEVKTLQRLAREKGIPLILDNAYGTPFPNLIFTEEATPTWDDNTIVCLSLSKLGLPAIRTGIVIAHEEHIDALARVNAILNLSPGSFGGMLAMDLIKSRDILKLSKEIIQPFYYNKAMRAVDKLRKEMGSDTPYAIHKPEGAMFLWLWMKDLPIGSQELYNRLKDRGVLVVPGNHFFPGIDEDWKHKQECIRITYSQEEEKVMRGLEIIAEEVKKAYQ